MIRKFCVCRCWTYLNLFSHLCGSRS